MYELHAEADDFNLTAMGEDESGEETSITIEYFLLDDLGDYLVDEDGFFLIIPETIVSSGLIRLHAEADDFNLNAE